MKHVKDIYETMINLPKKIGRGSVVLIKGAPKDHGKYLYVTTIKDFIEIKPGVKMVRLNTPIKRVIVKDGDKFYGRLVDFRREDGLIDVLNTKNPGTVSLVLNNNKTPYHWITTKHTDIGQALRSIQSMLFSDGYNFE